MDEMGVQFHVSLGAPFLVQSIPVWELFYVLNVLVKW